MRLPRFLPFFWVVLGVFSVSGQDLGRAERLWKEYLGETVRRGIPVGGNFRPEERLVSPRWIGLDRALDDARSLEPGPDTDLVAALVSGWEDDGAAAAQLLRGRWPTPGVRVVRSGVWGEVLFQYWDPATEPKEWLAAWMRWEGKVYRPRALVQGLEVLEKLDPGSLTPLLAQAVGLYPEDRRFLPLVSRHPEVVSDSVALLVRDRSQSDGWAPTTLRSWLDRFPGCRPLLEKAGYSKSVLDEALVRDYGVWLTSPGPGNPEDGGWSWDSGQTGTTDSHLVFVKGSLETWTKVLADGGIWTLGFRSAKPWTISEIRGGARWTLTYEDYPLVKTLKYEWGSQSIVYRFRPLSLPVPLWPPERFNAGMQKLPAVLADLWIPLDPQALVQKAASVENWTGPVLVRQFYLYQGQVWLSVEDSDRDGRMDTWSYFRNGVLESVYRSLTDQGRGVDLREIYRKGILDQVQATADGGKKLEFVLFPSEGVQIWDPRGTGRPLERLFVWEGSDKLNALVFSGSQLPWDTMPVWEPRP